MNSRPFMSLPQFMLRCFLFVAPVLFASGATAWMLERHHHRILIVLLVPVWMILGWLSGEACVEHFREILRRKHGITKW
jgi:hypothetical protein